MSINKMKDGKRWYVSVRYKDYTGAIKQHKKEGFVKKSDAVEYERDFLMQKSGSSDMTIKNLYKIYMDDCKARLKPTTFSGKDFLFKTHILPYFGDKSASTITPADIRMWQNQMMTKINSATKKPYTETYLKTVNNQISAIFNFGTKYYGLKNNPCRIAGSMGKKNADSMQFWTKEEFTRFLDAVSDKEMSLVIFSILFWTGMRSGELLALTKNDILFDIKSINIDKNYARLNGEDLILDPKTPKSKRKVLVPDFLLEIIKNYLDKLQQSDSSTRIFEGTTKHYISHEMQRGSRLSGVKKIRVHDLRHSHASLLIELGFSPLLISERLGHEDIQTTLQTYSHLYPNKHGEVADKLQAIFDNNI